MSNKNYAKNIIVIAPHPDDETLGCGGTILKHKADGDRVACVFITNITEAQGYSAQKIQERQGEIEQVSKLYGFDSVFKLNYPTTTLDSTALLKLVPDISKIFSEFQPNTVYLPNGSDIHSDHRVTFEAVMSCTKSFRYPFIEKILAYETVSETEFASEDAFEPNYFIDISDYLNKKLEIMKVYKSEVQEHPMPRSLKNIEALATFRGATINKNYAESYKLIKLIES